MKIGIYGGEAFPVYFIYDSGFNEMNIDLKTYERWKRVFNEFCNVQEEIKERLEDNGYDAWPQDCNLRVK